MGVDVPFPAIIPGGTVLPPGSHFLLAGESYTGSAIPDFQVPVLGVNWINASDLIWVRDGGSVLIDAVAVNHAGGEGDWLRSLNLGLAEFDKYSYDRLLGGCYDTNDNAHDFTPWADPGTPQSLTSPLTPCV